jgi:hypothetical protein
MKSLPFVFVTVCLFYSDIIAGQIFRPDIGEKVRVVLASGDTIAGTVVSIDSAQILLKTVFGNVSFNRTGYRELLKDSKPVSVIPLADNSPVFPQAGAPVLNSGEKMVVTLKNGDRMEGVITLMTADMVTIHSPFGEVAIPKAEIASITELKTEVHEVPIESLSDRANAISTASSDQRVSPNTISVNMKEGEIRCKYGFLLGVEKTSGNMIYLDGEYRYNNDYGIHGSFLLYHLSEEYEYMSYTTLSMDSQMVTGTNSFDMVYISTGPTIYLANGVSKDIAGEVVKRSFSCLLKPGATLFSMGDMSIFGLYTILEAEVPLGRYFAIPASVTYMAIFAEGETVNTWNFDFDLMIRPFKAFQNIQIRLGTLIRATKDQSTYKMINLGLTYGFGPLYKSLNMTGGTP